MIKPSVVPKITDEVAVDNKVTYNIVNPFIGNGSDDKEFIVDDFYGKSLDENDAFYQMRKRTEEQIKMLQENGKVVNNDLFNKTNENNQLNQPNQPIQSSQNYIDVEIKNKKISNFDNKLKNTEEIKKENMDENKLETISEEYKQNISQPNYNTPFDVITFASKGKQYKNKKENVKVSYLNTLDESILSSPNLLKSGDFLEILINRKLLDSDIRYNDLLIGDRNVLMIWLRATGYGEEYPITLFDSDDELFSATINLSELKIDYLKLDSDDEGLFDFVFPKSKSKIKFRFLTCGMEESIDKLVKKDKDNGEILNKTNIYILQNLIVEIDGNRDRDFVNNFIITMRTNDIQSFLKYIEDNQCGVDMNIKVDCPKGYEVESVLPINMNFFWPNIRV
jgi:hypothetical protein